MGQSLAKFKERSTSDSAESVNRRGIDQIDSLLHEIAVSIDGVFEDQIADGHGLSLQARVDQLQDAVITTAEVAHTARLEFEEIVRNQAETITRSAQIIAQLEDTKRQLVQARAEAEQAARDKEQLARTIYARTSDAVLILKDGHCVSCNQNSLRLFECTEPELLDTWPACLTAEKLLGGARDERLIRAMMTDALDGLPGLFEAAFQRDDSIAWCEIKMSSFEMNGATHVLVNIADISSRQQFENAVRQHRDFLNSIINSVPDPLCVTDGLNKIVVANDAFCDAIDRTRKQVVGSDASLTGLATGPGVDDFVDNYHKDLLVESEIARKHRDGSTREYSVRRALFEDGLTDQRYLIALSRDVTQQRQREDRLGLLASVFNNIAEGVAILSTNGHILEANPRFLELIACEHPTGKLLADTIDLQIENFESILASVSNGTPWTGKTSTVDAEGQERWFWLSLSPSQSVYNQTRQIIALFSDVTQLERSQKQLEKQALIDNLTGLPNRRMFTRHINSLIRTKKCSETNLAICFMDLDDFKSINDVSGHSTGDKLLVEVGQILKAAFGSNAMVARFGGDEFAAVWEYSQFDAASVTETLSLIIERFQQPILVGEMELTTGMSIGTSIFPLHGRDSEALMSNADIAMYAAKAAGKNQARIFSKEMQARTEQRHCLQQELRRALAEGEIKLAFQPKVTAQTMEPAGCEALARWIKPDGTNVSPGEFIPVAEESGLILQLGTSVLKSAITTAKQWAITRPDLLPIAVNVSPQQLRSPTFVDQLIKLVADLDARPEWIELEITENAVIEDIQFAIATFKRMHEHGFRIAIDDFGTGYSSLNYLRHFRIDTLKIDRSFVSEVTNDRNLAAISSAIIALGHGLGLTVVAEGVETEAQRAFLASAGCDILQGYLIGRPMMKEVVESWTLQLPVATQAQ